MPPWGMPAGMSRGFSIHQWGDNHYVRFDPSFAGSMNDPTGMVSVGTTRTTNGAVNHVIPHEYVEANDIIISLVPASANAAALFIQGWYHSTVTNVAAAGGVPGSFTIVTTAAAGGEYIFRYWLLHQALP